MDRGEPTLVPEWYKGSTSSGSASGNANHHNGSSPHSDEYAVKSSSRNRLSVSALDRDALRSLSFDRDSSSNSSPYSSFGRKNRDREREKNNDFQDRGRSHNVENGFSIYTDSYIGSRTERDTFRRSHTMGSERRHEAITKRHSNDRTNGVISGTGIISSISKPSFERDFPSLGAEERRPEVARVSSPGLCTAIDSLTRITSATIGGDGWTSALAEIPVHVGGNGTAISSIAQSISVGVASSTLTSSTGLNMAETLAQAPSRIHSAPQIPVDTKKIEELTRLQYSKLIPVTPSMPKSLASNSSEKLKTKGARSGDHSGLSKVAHNTTSQVVNHTLHAPARSDTTKASQVGNFQVLNRERNGITPGKDAGVTNVSKFLVPLGGVTTVISPPPKSPINMKPKLELRGLSPTDGERRPNSQAQNRNDFFNIIRQKAPSDRPADLSDSKCSRDAESGATGNNGLYKVSNRSAPNFEEETSSLNPTVLRSIAGKETVALNYVPINGDVFPYSQPFNISRTISSDPVAPECIPNIVDESYLDSDLPEPTPESGDEVSSSDPVAAPSEEEVAFLRQLGWDENAGGDEITAEEIEDFVRQHPEQKTSLRRAAIRFSQPSQSGLGSNCL